MSKIKDLTSLLTSKEEAQNLPQVSLFLEKRPLVFLKKTCKNFIEEDTEKVFSLIVYPPRGFQSRFRENPDFFEKNPEEINSELDSKLNEEIWENDATYRKQVQAILNEWGVKQFDENYGEKLDEAYEIIRKKITSKVLRSLMEESVYLDILNSKDEEEDSDAIMKEVKIKLKDRSYASKLKKDLQKTRINYQYFPRYNKILGEVVGGFVGGSYGAQQLFFKKSKTGNLSYIATSGHGSSTRENKGFYSHLFASLSKEREIPTFVLSIESDFSYHLYKSDSLILDGGDLTGNFDISKEKSKEILGMTKLIYGFDDIKWPYFLQSKLRYKRVERDE